MWTLPGPINYSKPQITAIVEAAGGFPVKIRSEIERRQAVLTNRLQDLNYALFFNKFLQNTPSASSLYKKWASIESSCDRLLKELEIRGDDPKKSPFLIHALLTSAARYGQVSGCNSDMSPKGEDFPRPENVETVIASLMLLGGWARMAKDYANHFVGLHNKSAKPPHAPDQALQQFFEGLGGIWLELFERRPGVSVSDYDGSVGGPFFRFVKAIFAALRENVTPDMETAEPTLLKDLAPSDYAIRNRIKRMDTSNLE